MSIYDFHCTDQDYISKWYNAFLQTPFLPDGRLKEATPQSKLGGKSGVFSLHLRPSRGADKRCRIISCVNIRSATLPTKNNQLIQWTVSKGKGCNTRYTALSHNFTPIVFKNRHKVRSSLAMMEMGCISGGRKAQDSYQHSVFDLFARCHTSRILPCFSLI